MIDSPREFEYPFDRTMRRIEWWKKKGHKNARWQEERRMMECRRRRARLLHRRMMRILILGSAGLLWVMLSLPLWFIAFFPQEFPNFDRSGAVALLVLMYLPFVMYRQFRRAAWLCIMKDLF